MAYLDNHAPHQIYDWQRIAGAKLLIHIWGEGAPPPYLSLANIEKIRKMRTDAGRSAEFEVTVGGRVTSVDDVKRYEDAGVTRILASAYTNPREAKEGIARFGEEIIAKL